MTEMPAMPEVSPRSEMTVSLARAPRHPGGSPRSRGRPRRLRFVLALLAAGFSGAPVARGGELRLAAFSADVTIPLGHRCMGVLPVKARTVVDPLTALGFILLGGGEPIACVAVDWCEIRNRAYDRWRDALARAAGTRRERVLVASVHQHDAPVVDLEAEELLATAGLGGELCDVAFHETAVERVARALQESLERGRRVTHLGLGQARVEGIASNRRVELGGGRISYGRGSASGADPALREAPEGLIDPWLRTLSFWDGDEPLLALHAYATHPMSHYGRGGVSADFVGLARRRRQEDDPRVTQIYVSGASGDVAAGKYNDGSPENRAVLAERLYRAMKAAWRSTRRVPLERVAFRETPLELPFRTDPDFGEAALTRTLGDPQAAVGDRILAALGLSSRRRIARGEAIGVPVIDFGCGQVVLLPAESFVRYQLLAQEIRADSFVLVAGYGECWPGYIPTDAAFREGFGESWCWVGPGVEGRMRAALERVLAPPRELPGLEAPAGGKSR